MNLLPEEKIWTRGELATKMKGLGGTHPNTYVGVYESANENREVTVDLKNSKATGVLFLASYSQVHWVIKNPTSIKAVVVGSYEKGTQVRGVPNGVPIYYTDYETLPYEYSLAENCDSYQDFIAACEYIYQLSSIDEALVAITGRKLDSFTGEYAANVLTVPGTIIDAIFR
jgi:hypothetical protein